MYLLQSHRPFLSNNDSLQFQYPKRHKAVLGNGTQACLYSSTCLGRPPSWVATCFVRPRYQCPDRHISTLNYLWSAATCNERTLLPGPEGVRSWQVLLYLLDVSLSSFISCFTLFSPAVTCAINIPSTTCLKYFLAFLCFPDPSVRQYLQNRFIHVRILLLLLLEISLLKFSRLNISRERSFLWFLFGKHLSINSNRLW